MIHIIYTPFTGLGVPDFRGEEWFKHRIKIFKKYTLKSLLNQTNRNFVHWISFRQEEAGHPLVKELGEYLFKLKYNFVFTFDGLLFYDDKTLNYHLEERLANSLSFLESCAGDCVYLTLLASDDMFSKNVVELIQGQQYENGKALVFLNGYLFNEKTKELAEWYHPSPPFYTLMFDKETFFNAKKHLEFYNVKTHEEIVEKFNCVNLGDFNYCVNIHGKNISTVWEHPYRKRLIKGKEKIKIFNKFAIK